MLLEKLPDLKLLKRGNDFPNFWLVALNFAASLVPITIVVLVPFLIRSNLLQWDMLGHYFSAWYTHNFLLPYWTGWNPYFFCGFAQGTFYPPLFHYLIALLGFVMPIAIAFKLVVSISVFATPLAIYYFARSFGLSQSRSAVTMTATVMLLVGPIVYCSENNFVGGTLSSTFFIGLVVNAFALPFFFFYLGQLRRGFFKQDMRLASVVLTILAFSHTLTLLAACIFSAVFSLILCRSKRELILIGKHAVFTLALSAIWIVPFAVYISESDTAKIQLKLGTGSFLLIMIGVSGLIWAAIANRLQRISVPGLYFLILSVLVLIGNFYNYPFHIYRFVSYPLFLVPLLIVDQLPMRLLGATTAICFALLSWGLVADKNFYQNLEQVNFGGSIEKISSRTMILSNMSEEASAHINQLLIPMKYDSTSIKGLFVESSRTSKFLLALEKLLDPDAMLWGVPFPDLSQMPAGEKNAFIRRHLQTFGIERVLSPKSSLVIEASSRRPSLSYPLHGDYWQIEGLDEVPRVPVINNSRYFYSTKDSFIFVENGLGDTAFTKFHRPSDLGEKAVVKIKGISYYIRQRYPDLFFVDFILDGASMPLSSKSSLPQLASFISSIKLDEKQRATVDTLLENLAEELSQKSISFAMSEFKDAPVLSPEAEVTVTVRNEQRKIVQADKDVTLQDFRFQKAPLVKVIETKPIAISDNWDEAVAYWFMSQRTEQELIDTTDGQPVPVTEQARITEPSSVIQNVKFSATHDQIAFDVAATGDTPILIKESYFPRWQAFADGKPIRIFRASPNFMLVYAHGHTELRYRSSWIDLIGIICSLIGAIGIAMSYIQTARNNEQ